MVETRGADLSKRLEELINVAEATAHNNMAFPTLLKHILHLNV